MSAAPEDLSAGYPATLKNTIPPMTDPAGKYWRQPDPATILIDNTHAVLTRQQFDELLNYSTTLPTGTYPGKMWRGYRRHVDGRLCWFLYWYGAIVGDQIEIEAREALIA